MEHDINWETLGEDLDNPNLDTWKALKGVLREDLKESNKVEIAHAKRRRKVRRKLRRAVVVNNIEMRQPAKGRTTGRLRNREIPGCVRYWVQMVQHNDRYAISNYGELYDIVGDRYLHLNYIDDDPVFYIDSSIYSALYLVQRYCIKPPRGMVCVNLTRDRRNIKELNYALMTRSDLRKFDIMYKKSKMCMQMREVFKDTYGHLYINKHLLRKAF